MIGSYPFTRLDNDPQPVVTIAVESSTVTEGESIRLTATLTGRFVRPVQVGLEVTAPEGALSGTVPGVFRFATSQSAVPLTVTTADNGSAEDERTIDFALAVHPDYTDYTTPSAARRR